MNKAGSINILIAEDNDVSREMMAGILRAQGYEIFGAIDGNSAIQLIRKTHIDLALVDINMAPAGGFEFVKYLLVNRIKIPVVIITADSSSDILMKANELGVSQVIHKPVTPDRLTGTVSRTLERHGVKTNAFATSVHHTILGPEDIMARVLEMASQNVTGKQGRPFAAIVANAEGKILGKGVNGPASRADPVAHAEVMAIRQAAETLSRADLSDCLLYSSSEPTAVGKALIASVGIKTVYYGLGHEDIRGLTEESPRAGAFVDTAYIRMCPEETMAVFKAWKEKNS